MGRIFISAGHGGLENGYLDTGTATAGTTEAQEMILLRDLVVTDLRSRNFEVLSVPDEMSNAQSLDWINLRYRPGDVALEIHTATSNNAEMRGATVFYIANNTQRRNHAELVLFALMRQVPNLTSRGVKPDTQSSLGNLSFCRQILGPSLFAEVCHLTSPDDRTLLQTRRRNFAVGIADGLAAWSRALSGGSSPTEPILIDINVNGGIYGEQGLLINDNAYVPVDLVDGLGIDLSTTPNIRRVTHRNIVYIRAIDLREFNVAVNWDNATRTVMIQTNLKVCPGDFDRIMGYGKTTEVQLKLFLQSNNEDGLERFPDLPRLYREEGAIERVNYDIAFAQMCVETGFLKFGGDVKPEQNNFAGLGAVGGGAAGASFPSSRIGVRAQIQHLKAYGSTEPIVQDIVDPRFPYVTRGIAPLVDQLSGRWAADPNYGKRVLSVLRRLYESAGLL